MPIVWIPERLLKQLYTEAIIKEPLETGGILMGYKDAQNNVVVTDLIKAGPKATHGKFYFIPDGEYQQEEISRIYFKSNRLTTYLGDWHSHPNENSYMSWMDRMTLKNIAKTKSAREPNPIFIIVGTKNLKSNVGVIILLIKNPLK